MFVWSGISTSGELGLLPLPLAGEGWGGGERIQMDLFAGPPPNPPPPPGEGMHRARGVMSSSTTEHALMHYPRDNFRSLAAVSKQMAFRTLSSSDTPSMKCPASSTDSKG